jgi:hypothetical protein
MVDCDVYMLENHCVPAGDFRLLLFPAKSASVRSAGVKASGFIGRHRVDNK